MISRGTLFTSVKFMSAKYALSSASFVIRVFVLPVEIGWNRNHPDTIREILSSGVLNS
jgi:hypothetical protein